MLTHINNFSIILLFTERGFTLVWSWSVISTPKVPIKQESFYKQWTGFVFYVCKNYERSCFARKLLKRPINGQKRDYMNGRNWHSLLWGGEAHILGCFLDKNSSKCHVYESPTPGDTVFATFSQFRFNLRTWTKSGTNIAKNVPSGHACSQPFINRKHHFLPNTFPEPPSQFWVKVLH